MTKNTAIILFVYAFTLLVSCQNQEADIQNIPLDKTTTDQAIVNNKRLKEEKIKEIFYSLPSPLEMSLMFQREGAVYHSDVLHSTEELSKYNSLRKKALNLGIYGADLSYAGLFSNTQDAIKYFVASKKLADELGISGVFEQDHISRLEQNAGNKDTLLQVITDFFLENDIYLKTQAQQHISTYVLLGGWIESMYLGGEMINRDEVQGLKEIVAMQKGSMQNLINLLNTIPDNQAEDSLKAKMQVLAAIYDKVEVEYPIVADKSPQESLQLSGKQNGELKVKMSDPVLQAILNELKSIRNYISR